MEHRRAKKVINLLVTIQKEEAGFVKFQLFYVPHKTFNILKGMICRVEAMKIIPKAMWFK